MAIAALAAAAIGAAAPALTGCGGSDRAAARRALAQYVERVEPVRLAVNRLLDQADPILHDYGRKRIDPGAAQRRLGALERRFAGYTAQIAAIEPRTSQLSRIHVIYAHTYVLEDAYLSALVAALPDRRFEDLPRTQGQQRAAIVEWRTGLMVLAERLGVRLPADIQQAGRGEIAPSPEGS
jgi:hypothetical protein